MAFIGKELKRCREQRKLTQKELGDLCGMKDSQIRAYELNKKQAKIETLQRIANALNVSLSELLPSLGAQFDKQFPDAKEAATYGDPFENYLAVIDIKIQHLGGTSDDEDGDFKPCQHILTQGNQSVTLTDEQYKNFQQDVKHIIKSYAQLDDVDKGRILERFDVLLENSKYLSKKSNDKQAI